MGSNDDRVYGAVQYSNTPTITVVLICVLVVLAIIDRMYYMISQLARDYEVTEINEQFHHKILGLTIHLFILTVLFIIYLII